MTSRIIAVSRRNHLAKRQASTFPKDFFFRAIRMMGPTLLALSFAGVAQAQGTMNFSGATTLMGTFKTFAVYAGAVICFGGLIFAGIRMMRGCFQDAIPGLCGALSGAGVLGRARAGLVLIPGSRCKSLSCTRQGGENRYRSIRY